LPDVEVERKLFRAGIVSKLKTSPTTMVEVAIWTTAAGRARRADALARSRPKRHRPGRTRTSGAL
jgi:hypothetical protein